ncbi:MAG: endopeptidase La [Lachnospiraceae bacterium]|nr:endopeptidase La [Lachnospiraceae bacterium]
MPNNEKNKAKPIRVRDNEDDVFDMLQDSFDEHEQTESRRMIVIPQNNKVVFNEMVAAVDLPEGPVVDAVKEAMLKHESLFLVLRVDLQDETLSTNLSEYHEMGSIVDIRQIMKAPSGAMRAFVCGMSRGSITSIRKVGGVLYGEIEEMPMEVIPMRRVEKEALQRALQDLIERFFEVADKKVPEEVFKRLQGIRDLDHLVNQTMILMPIPVELRQALLEAKNNIEQYQTLSRILANETEVMRIRHQLKEKVQEELDKNQRDYILREQLKVIRSELGDNAESAGDEYMNKLDTLEASDAVKEAIRKEIKRFTTLGTNSSEYATSRDYIETLLTVPWDHVSEDNENLLQAKEILERDHYGLKDVKERVTEFLAVHMYAKQADSPILCLVGPPGTGKTSIAKSIAEAMNRQYVRVCLGGVSDEAEIRGHRRTYVASLPGRIIQGMIQAGTANPLMLLDEVDKLGSDYKGDPASALLEVLDSAQNSRFVDHYIEIPMDMSRVMFIATANTTETIPRPLLDRMEIIEINSYLRTEKHHIAKEHLIPKQMKRHGLTSKQVGWSDKAVDDMIEYYTREAGVRELERTIGKVCRKVVLGITEAAAEGKKAAKANISGKNLTEYLGRYRYHPEDRIGKATVGVVRGLAWTAVGGATMEIEVNIFPGGGKLALTGNIGNVMRESAITGINYIRSLIGGKLEEGYFDKNSIHIHIPEGAVPKDGPSAGITMATAVYSAITGKPVAADVAMTGEITLRGRVLPIGGLREKLLAAKSVGIRKVLIPIANKETLAEIPAEVTEGMEICPVKTMEEVLREAIVTK